MGNQKAQAIGQCELGCMSGFVIAKELTGLEIRRCKCLETEITNHNFHTLKAHADIDGCEGMTFDRYIPTHHTQAIAKTTLQRHGSYYLCGSYGTGKTHLATASVLAAISCGIPSVRISVPRLLDVIRKAGRDGGTNTNIEEQAAGIPYLVLDDIGRQKDTDWTDERLFLLIDSRSRLSESGQGHTTITSNYTLADLKKRVSGAIIDRIGGMCQTVIVLGDSYRIKK